MLLSASLSQPFLSLLAQRDVWTDSTSGRPPPLPPSSFFYGIVTLWVSSPLYLQQEQLPLVTEMVSKKKKTLWNSLQNLLWMGQLWQKSESPVNLPHSVQPKAAERQHSSSGNSRTRPAAVMYASSQTRGDARSIIIAFAQRLRFLWSRPAQIVIDTKTRLIARPHFEPSYRSRWRRRRVACVTIH